jgi:hypothetical protein
VHNGLPLGGIQIAEQLLFEGIGRGEVGRIYQRISHRAIITDEVTARESIW